MSHANHPHDLDMWYYSTGEENSSIPFCSGVGGYDGMLECGKMFANKTGFDFGVDPLTVRLDCESHVRVPEYYLDTAIIESSGNISHDSSGHMIFTERVCACQYVWGLKGKQCVPIGFGIVLQVACVAMLVWLLLRLGRAVSMFCNGNFESRTKKFLIILATLQHIGQIMWLVGWLNIYFIIHDRETMVTYLVNLGFTLATLFMFMFICALTSQTSAFLRPDAHGAFKMYLRWIERIFAVLPFVVAVVTWLLVADTGLQTRVGLLIFQSIIIVAVIIAFGFLIKVVNKRVRRLLPPRGQNGQVKTEISFLKRMLRFMTCRTNTGRDQLDDTSEQLLSTSKRLRHMASSLRTSLVCYAILGALFIAISNFEDTPSRIVRVPEFLIWQLILSSIPTVGITGLALMQPAATLRKMRNARFRSSVAPESSCVGSLTS